MYVRMLVASSLAALAGCATSAPASPGGVAPTYQVASAPTDFRGAADSLAHADAARDVAAALERADRRLLGVQRYLLVLPGVPTERYGAVEREYGVRVLGGTSDSWDGEDHAAYNRAAEAYAERYNRELLRRLGTR